MTCSQDFNKSVLLSAEHRQPGVNGVVGRNGVVGNGCCA